MSRDKVNSVSGGYPPPPTLPNGSPLTIPISPRDQKGFIFNVPPVYPGTNTQQLVFPPKQVFYG